MWRDYRNGFSVSSFQLPMSAGSIVLAFGKIYCSEARCPELDPAQTGSLDQYTAHAALGGLLERDLRRRDPVDGVRQNKVCPHVD